MIYMSPVNEAGVDPGFVSGREDHGSSAIYDCTR